MNEKYLIQTSDFLTEKESEILTYFYQPLLGIKPITLYRFLFSESVFMENNSSSMLPFQRIASFLSFTFEEIQDSLKKLAKWNLICVFLDEKQKEKVYLFELKKPSSVSEFFNNESYYEKLSKQIPSKFLEIVYLKFKNLSFTTTNPNFLQTFNTEQKNKFNLVSFVKKWPKTEFPNFDWTKKELNAVEVLQKQFNLNEDILEILIDYTIEKNNGQKISPNYLLTIVEDLNQRKILHHKEKLQFYFLQMKTSKIFFQKNWKKIDEQKTPVENFKNFKFLFN